MVGVSGLGAVFGTIKCRNKKHMHWLEIIQRRQLFNVVEEFHIRQP